LDLLIFFSLLHYSCWSSFYQNYFHSHHRNVLWIEVAAILKCRMSFEHSAIAVLCWYQHVSISEC